MIRWAARSIMNRVFDSRIAVVGIDITMTTVTPIVTGLTGASQFARAGSSMTVSPPEPACITSGHLPASQLWSSAP